MSEVKSKEKIIVIGAGPVGALAALYAARRGNDVDVYELRSGKFGNMPLWLYALTKTSVMSYHHAGSAHRIVTNQPLPFQIYEIPQQHH